MTFTAEQLRAEIESLKAENLKLKKRKEKKSKPKVSLPNVESPDPKLLVTAEQVAELLVNEGILPKAERSDAYQFFKFFKLRALAQTKDEHTKGIGKRLYMTGDVMDAMRLLKGFAGK